MSYVARIKQFFIHLLLPMPLKTRDVRYSVIHDGQNGSPSSRLLTTAIDAIRLAGQEDVSSISSRVQAGTAWSDIWPGEHYKLLAALVRVLNARSIIEIGTFQGFGALALMKNLGVEGRVMTFDIVPYDQVPNCLLSGTDFESGQLTQEIADLADMNTVLRYQTAIEQADLIFIDAAKDGIMERRFLQNFSRLKLLKNPIVVLDDIRLWNMLEIWNSIDRPKLDMTSFGHWSGTGLIDWNG